MANTMQLVVLLAMQFSTAALQTIFEKYEHTGYIDRRISPSIKSFGTRSKSECAVACEQTDTCIGFNIKESGECELLRYNPNDQLVSTVSEAGWAVYSQHKLECWPDGYDGFVRDGMCYFWKQSEQVLPWVDGQADCRAHGAELVCIESQEENDALVAAVPMWLWWFGLNDLDSDGVFTCNGNVQVFINWAAPNQPGSDLCVGLHDSGTQEWHTGTCYSGLSYVCEMKWY